MSYQCGIGPSLMAIGIEPRDPRIICDVCGVVLHIKPGRRMLPPSWFLDGKAAPGWKMKRVEDDQGGMVREDFCPRCKGGR